MRRFLVALESEETTPPTPVGNPIPEAAFVFLGGTCNGSTWREKLVIPHLAVPFFNPVVENWTEADRDNEERAKKEATYLLYVLTPKQEGIYSLVEAAVDVLKAADKFVVLAFLADDDGELYDDADWKSVIAAVKLLAENTESKYAKVCDSVETAVAFLNKAHEGMTGQ